MRESFIFYRSFYEAIKDLPRDVQGEIYTAIMEYSLNGNEAEHLKPIARSIFTLIKPQIDANTQRYENGKKGGRPKSSKNQKETKDKPNVNENANENENLNKEKTGKKTFTPPTEDEVAKYCSERANGINTRRFIDFYQSKGWMIGKNKMTDWQAAVRTWEQGNNQKTVNETATNEQSESVLHPALR